MCVLDNQLKRILRIHASPERYRQRDSVLKLEAAEDEVIHGYR